MASTVPLIVAASTILIVAILVRKTSKRSATPLPPGPLELPLLGNVLNFPTYKPWIKFWDWSREFNSDVISFTVFGKRIVILNTLEATQELFVKRGLNYSSRPRIPMLDLVGRSIDWLFLNYTTDRLWRDHRKIYHREFDTQTLLHRPYELSATRQLLKRLLDTPYDYVSHLRSTASEAILETTFGIPINSTDDPLLALVERFNTSLDNGMNVLINIFPFFSRLPRWAPGTSFYRIADELRRNSIDMPQIPLSIVQKQMSDGSARSSVALRGLTALEESSTDYTYDFRVLQNVLAGIYAAGADTTLTAMRWFIFSMLKYPEIQAKAHQLIDKQTEGKRLPDFESDFGTLPYIDAILNEVLRFFPVLPIGMPHCVVEDDVYEGYLLPKDAIVFGNSWAIMRDERMYGADTHLFRPDRFLNADGTRNSAIPDPDQAFGYGRRVCAGKNVAREFLWIMIVSILATFEISKVIAQDGSLIDPDGKHSSSLVCHPLPFQCKITPRSNGEKLALNGLDYLSK